MSIKEAFLGLRPLMGKEAEAIDSLELFLEDEDLEIVSKLRKQLKISFYKDTLGVTLFEEKPFMLLRAKSADTAQLCKELNDRIRLGVNEHYFEKFSHDAFNEVTDLLCPKHNMLIVRQAAALQLFCNKLHILMMGDNNTGKNEIAMNAAQLAPVASSGSSGIFVMPKGKAVVPGLLEQAGSGLCVITDMRLIRNEEKQLLDVMSKGKITYLKGKEQIKHDINASILATTSPSGDRFFGDNIKELRKQIQLDKNLLNQFNLVFVIRKPGTELFGEKKTKHEKVHETDAAFVKEYIKAAKKIEVKFPSALQEDVLESVKQLRENERNKILSVPSGISATFVELAKASARMELRNIVSDVDMVRVKNIIHQSFEIS